MNHKKIIFSGDGYSSRWETEAKLRGLSNKNNTVDAILVLKDSKMTKMLIDLGIYTQVEIDSRYEVLMEGYCKCIQVEALTALTMAKNEFYPASIKYLNKVSETANNVLNNGVDNTFLVDDVKELSRLISNMKEAIKALENDVKYAQMNNDSILNSAIVWRDNVLKSMSNLREIVDELETIVDKKYWPIPTYVDLMFGL
jgi:glutamine synthetase